MDIAAFVLSIIAILLNFVKWWRDGARLKVESRMHEVKTSKRVYGILWIDVKNKGRSPTVVDAVTFPERRWFKTEYQAITGVDEVEGETVNLPFSLPPGKVGKFKISVDSLMLDVIMTKAKPSQLRIRVHTGHGNRIKRLPKEVVTELERRLAEREAEQGG